MPFFWKYKSFFISSSDVISSYYFPGWWPNLTPRMSFFLLSPSISYSYESHRSFNAVGISRKIRWVRLLWFILNAHNIWWTISGKSACSEAIYCYHNWKVFCWLNRLLASHPKLFSRHLRQSGDTTLSPHGEIKL